MTRFTNIFNINRKPTLHIAPEGCMRKPFIKILGSNYITADLYDPDAMVKMDITNINFPDFSFDYILISHVLEHVENDIIAIGELYRVLNQRGTAIIIVPIEGKITYEDRTIIDPVERLKHFGQKDHVRYYGYDFVLRLRNAGFKVSNIRPKDFLSDYEIEQMGINQKYDEIFHCVKK